MPRFSASRMSALRGLRPVRAIEPLDEDEQALAAALAGELSRLTVEAGERRGGRPLPRRSLGAKVQTRLAGFNEDARGRIVSVAGKVVERRAVPDTGRVLRRRDDGGRGEALRRRGRDVIAAGLGLDADLSEGLRAMARRRLEAARPEMLEAAEDLVQGSTGRDAAIVSRTDCDLRLAGEGQDTWRREIGFSSVELLDFRWQSREPGAERGYWELRGPVTPGHEGDLIASGYVPDAMRGDAVGGYFNIPLRDHLPPKPPQETTIYHVRVLPLGGTGGGGLVRDRVRDRVIGPIGDREAPAGIGAWSPPAVIRYGQSHETPPQHFDIEPMSIYRKARFRLDWLRLVQDQTGPGDEEYHLAGFLIRHTPQGADVPVKIGPYSLTLDPDDRSKHHFGTQATFSMMSAKHTYWPQTFSVLLSIMEEDDGGLLNDWHAALAEVAEEMMSDIFTDEIEEFMREVQEQIAELQREIAAEMAAEIAALIAAYIASTAREIISAAIAVVVAWIMAHIRSGAVDDFYGMRLFGMTLCTNDARLIEDGSAGRLFKNRPFASGGDFAGEVQADGSFRLELTELQFLGEGGALEGSPVSGIVNVGVHWEFDDRVDI